MTKNADYIRFNILRGLVARPTLYEDHQGGGKLRDFAPLELYRLRGVNHNWSFPTTCGLFYFDAVALLIWDGETIVGWQLSPLAKENAKCRYRLATLLYSRLHLLWRGIVRQFHRCVLLVGYRW